MVSIRILACGIRSLMACVASMPPRRGMRTSIKTTSGMSSCAFSIASAPSPASPTTSTSSSCWRTISSPRRNNAWSSTISTRMASPAPRGRVCRSSATLSPLTSWRIMGAPSHFGLDEPVAAVMATVHDVCLLRLGIREQEEVVPKKLHLVDSLLGRHRFHLNSLVPREGRLCGSFVGLRPQHSCHRLDALGVLRAVDPLSLELLDLSLEPVDDLVHGGGRVSRPRLGADEPGLGGHGDLDLVGLGHPWVPLLGELYVHRQDSVVEALYLGQLVLGVRTQFLGHVDILALHRHLHGPLPHLCIGRRTHLIAHGQPCTPLGLARSPGIGLAC